VRWKASKERAINRCRHAPPCFAATHIRVHLTVSIAVGFSSVDIVQMVDDAVVLGNYVAPFGPWSRKASIPIEAGAFRDIYRLRSIMNGNRSSLRAPPPDPRSRCRGSPPGPLAGDVVDHVEDPEPTPAGELVVHEV
jgi:hypothetical protein